MVFNGMMTNHDSNEHYTKVRGCYLPSSLLSITNYHDPLIGQKVAIISEAATFSPIRLLVMSKIALCPFGCRLMDDG